MVFDSVLLAFEPVLERLEAAIAPDLPDESVSYGARSFPLLDFARGIEVIGPAEGRSFLDVGSGIGTKVALASRLGFAAAGIERHPPYVTASRRLFPEVDFYLADAFEYPAYDDFDVVYCYRPLVDWYQQVRLNERIVSRLRPGAIFFSAGGPWPLGLCSLGAQVFRR